MGIPASILPKNPVELRRLEYPNTLDGLDPSSATASFLSEPGNMAVGHDDIENLSAIEKTFDVLKRSGGSLAASLWSTSEGLWGVPRAAGDFLQGVTKPLADATGLPVDLGGAISEYAKKEQHYAGQWAAWARGDNSKVGGFENSVYQGFESLGGNLLLAPITIASGTPTPMLVGMSGSAGGKSYGEARDKNLSPVTSLTLEGSPVAEVGRLPQRANKD
ncbi:MAG: hypothetical protein HXX17_11835 [Geobacteraceae bacterium]|nr:hypothetical protein [Geobacteraceae bacterium]